MPDAIWQQFPRCDRPLLFAAIVLTALFWIITPELEAQPPRESPRVVGRVGERLQFTASADGDQPETFIYQWRRDGAPIRGATMKNLVIPLYEPSDTGRYDVIVRNTFGSASSEPITVLVNDLQLSVTTLNPVLGSAVTLSLPIEYASDIHYQWRRNGLSIAGATEASLVLTNFMESDFGSYTVVIKSDSMEFATSPVLLRSAAIASPLPTITSEPLDLAITEGKPMALFVGTSDPTNTEYQWMLDGTNLVGATSQTLWLHTAKPGSYTVAVSNSFGTVTSRAAVVRLVAGQGRIANASSISRLRSGMSEMTGFVVSGASPKTFLLRAVGPTLLDLGLSDVLADPFLQLYDSRGQLVHANDNWGDGAVEDTAPIATAGASAGAYALKAGSKDAAFLVNLTPGAYTLRSNEGISSPGISITEIYDVDTPRPNAARLVNLSKSDTLARVTDSVLSGLVVDGTAGTTLLIRAIGPGLRTFGITNAAAQLQITVYNGANQVIASNTVWESTGASQAVVSASMQISAFPLSRGSADSCILITLPPGAYTAHLTSVGGSIGQVLLEVYEIP